MKATAAVALGLSAATRFCKAQTPLSTLLVPIPTQGTPFTTTVPACDSVPAFAVVGVPNGTFFPGTATIYVPPQVSGITTSFVDSDSNLTQVIIASPLPGTCAALSLPADATDTVVASATGPNSPSSTGVCPLEGCSEGVDEAAQTVIGLINEVAIASQKLQNAAKLIGSRRARGLEPRFSILSDIVTPLKDIAATLTFGLPTLAVLAPFPPGCDSDTIVVALIDFVRIHQALLEIFIGRAGLLSGGFGLVAHVDATPEQKFPNPLGVAIAGALRAIETGVDALAFSLIGLIPTRQACLKQQQASIDQTLKDAIAAYQS
ncbi:hypothetical protein F5Y13DRAFT_145724 [Hypoxylon sp. FL1857]|nr:hypothetical protein F5Y13DRAFT_145724 [Hypoxylon sp. FL1857]